MKQLTQARQISEPTAYSSATTTVRAGVGCETEHGAVMPPIHLSSTFAFAGLEQRGRYDYTRSGNPTRTGLAKALAELESGYGATVTSSGMAALNLVCQLLKPRELLLAPHDCYGGTHRLLTALSEAGHFDLVFVDQTNQAQLTAAFALGPRMILVETPSNPLLRITDFDLVSELARKYGSLLVADNTFLSPVLQQPITLGADIVVHSTTKYLNGHSDVVGGVAVAKNQTLHDQLEWWANCLGITGAPFDSFLTLRGLRTIHVRVKQQQANAFAIAASLRDHPRVLKVHYPGLGSHPGHEIAIRQQLGFGAMLSFELGCTAEVKRFIESLQLFSLAESLGGVESLVAHPATMTHAAMTPKARQTAGISGGLVRLSVGLEDVEDLQADVLSALNRLSIEAVN